MRKRVSHSLVRRDVEEEPLVLRGCVLWSVRARVAEDGQEGTVRLGLLGAAKERKGGVGDLREERGQLIHTFPNIRAKTYHVWEVVGGVVVSVLLPLPVPVDGVVVEP